MIQREEGIRRVQREAVTALGSASLTHWNWAQPVDFIVAPTPKHYWLELQLLAGSDNGYACFLDRWSRNRYEPLGRSFLLPPSQAVHFKCSARRSVSVACVFQPEAIQRWFDGDMEWTDSRLKQTLNVENPTLHNLLFRLSEELRAPNLASETLIELISAEIVIESARYYLGNEERQNPGSLAAWRMKLIDECLSQPGAKPSLSELADLCNLSPRQLTRAFRVSKGCSIGLYIVQHRINEAKRLLRTEQKMKSIAHALGYKSPSHFCSAFQRATGEKPSRYRRRAGQE